MKKTLFTAALACTLASSAMAATELSSAMIQEPNVTSNFHLVPDGQHFVGNTFTLMLVIDMEKLTGLTISDSGTHFVSSYDQTTATSIASTNKGYCGLNLKKDGDNYIVGTSAAGGANRASLTLGSVNSTGKAVVTLAIGTNNSSNPSTVYVYDGTTLTDANDDGLRYGSTQHHSIYFPNNGLEGAVDSLYLFNSRLSADDIDTLSTALLAPASIPEPATATLSLLALAGLAARRRRK